MLRTWAQALLNVASPGRAAVVRTGDVIEIEVVVVCVARVDEIIEGEVLRFCVRIVLSEHARGRQAPAAVTQRRTA